MDSTSHIVEKDLETKKETEEFNADVMASEEKDKTPKTPLESNSDSDLGKPQSQTGDKDDADLTTGDKLESKEGGSQSEITADIAVTPPSTTVTLIEKRSSSIGSLDAEEEEEEEEEEEGEEKEEEKEEDLPVKTDTTNISEMDKEENQKVAVVDDKTVSVSTSNARKSPVPQDTSNARIKGEDEEVQSTEKTVLKDCTESLTEEDPVEPTSHSSALAGESTRSEVDLPIGHAKNSEELENRSDRSDANKGKESQEMADQSELLDKKTKESEHPKTDQKDFNNQILDIISDIDINIKAQEKITQLKEQELELIKKQNELANQIHQQQILAQQLSAQNRFKQNQQSQIGTLDPQSHHQNERDLSASIFNQKNTADKETSNVSKTVDLRKIFTPATDSSEILPKNRKLYASSAFYSPSLHPTVEDQVELARRISHSLSDISNQTSKGQSMYVNRKNRSDKWVHEGRSQGAELFAKRRRKADNWIVDETHAGTQNHPSGIPDYQQYHQKPAISPNILPAYSDAGKHRVQLNIHQNQLIEKYSKPGLQVVQSPWEAALQTGSASSAFLEDNKGQCFSPTVSPTPYFHGGNIDLRDAVESTHNNAQNQYTNDNASSPQSTNVRSNPQRDLAYTPCVAQGWGGRNVELPKESHSQYGRADDSINSCIHLLHENNLTTNFAVDVQNRLHELEKFQNYFLRHKCLDIEMLRNKEDSGDSFRYAYQNPSDFTPNPEFEIFKNEDQSVKRETDEKVNVRELIQSFEQQNTTEFNQVGQATTPIENNEGLYVPKELSLSSYAAPPKQYGGHEQPFNLQSYESTRSLPTANFIANENPTTGRNEFPLSKPLKSGFSTLPPKQQLYAPTSYQRKPVGSEHIAPQVNFNPTPLSFDKLARYEQNDKKNLTGPNPHYLNVQQSSYVRNTSPIPFGIASNEQTSRSPSSIGSMGSPHCHLPTTGPSKCGLLTSSSASSTLNQGQTFNKCARGWGATQNNQQPYQSTYSLPVVGNLPYSDF
ncbi:uncharacterized protein LOC128263742 isoform X2 [Drosophila gunungcola]|uniref:uncharacterized protein LOC128263742 isoform X2 n=1 Tax=Drosophila gunungcola TaxID=103775 RepID=UPI0022E59DEE|nr:uncharacterized protein LOC128263742 isoform X2 [Drosophila gunungcola]